MSFIINRKLNECKCKQNNVYTNKCTEFLSSIFAIKIKLGGGIHSTHCKFLKETLLLNSDLKTNRNQLTFHKCIVSESSN